MPTKKATAPPLPITMDELFAYVLKFRDASAEELKKAFGSVEKHYNDVLRGKDTAINQLMAGATKEQFEHEVQLRRATLDPSGITEFYTRVVATKQLVSLLSERRCPRLSMLYIDIHAFKEINDKGPQKHKTGDKAITAIATILKKEVRDAYFVRWGGDEIVALMAGLAPKSLISLARRAQEAIEFYPSWPAVDEFFRVVRPRIDIGAIDFVPGKLEDREQYGVDTLVQDLISFGDRNMYLSKEDHRRGVLRAYCTTLFLKDGKLEEQACENGEV